MQSNLYAQIRALKLDLEARYPGFDLSITHPLFSWLVKHAQWLLNRYAQKSDGLTPFEKRWGKPYSGSLCRFAEVVHFRKVGKFPKAIPAWEEGLWLGRDTESNQHFVATPHGVFKTRSLRRRPPSEQIHKALLESLKATPWDPKGSREETDNFVFPSASPGATSQGVKPLERPDTAELPEDQPHGEEEIFQEAMEHFHEMVQESETRTFSDVPVQDDMAIEELAEGLLKRASEPASGATSSAEPPTSRLRVGPPPSVERKRETSDVPEATTKVQRISSLFRTSDHPMKVFDFRVSAVTTKQELDVPVAVNQDEAEMTLEERFKNPLFWQSPEFTYEEEMQGMNKEMKSMLNFDVFEEFKMSDLTPEQLETVISTRWVKTRKSDGTCRCRIVVRGYDQIVEDPDETYASTPSLLTLKTLLTLAVARGWHVTLADISTAFLHALMDGDVWVLPPVEYYPEGGVVWKLCMDWKMRRNFGSSTWLLHLSRKGFVV